MNEELKIVIKAVADEAKKEFAKIQEQLEGVRQEAEKAGKSSESLAKIGKVAMAIHGAIIPLINGMRNLATSAQEAKKAFGRLESGFISAGSTAEQAKKTYEGLYRFLGDVDTATEASNLLAQLTQDEQDLAEWTTILQGVYAKFPDSIPVESLAEAANETAKSGEITGALADALVWLGVSEDAFQSALNNTNSVAEREALIRSTLNGLYGGAAQLYEQTNASTLAYNESQAQLHSTLAQASYYLTPLLTNLSNLASTLLQVLGPVLQVVAAIIITFVQWIVAAAQAIGKFFGAFKGEGSKATNEVSKSISGVETSIGGATNGLNNMNKGLKNATNQAKELKRQTMGFDELNVMSSQSSASDDDTGADPIEIPDIEIPEIDMSDINLNDFEDQLEDVKKRMEGVLVLAGLVGAAFAAWGIVHLIQNFDTLKGKIAGISGTIMIIAGALLLVQGYSDAWANGVDWGNFALILSGIGLIVGGIALAFGPLAASIGLIVGSIAMLVLGIKDIVENGYSMEAVIMIAVGAIGLLIGVVWALNAALLANPITWVVVAIMALVAAFVILWNECEGFRQFFIDMWEAIKTAFSAVVEWLGDACEAIAQFFVDAWQAIKDAWSGVKQWFSDIWQGIKNVFSTVGKWFGDIFSGAWNGIKKAFSAVGSFFSGIWSSIKSIFSKVGSTIGDAVSGAFKSAINWVLEKAIGIINGFISAINLAIGVINLIPGVEITKLSKLEVPQLATGGIVTGDTLARIGEQGYKEAVLPLERNTEWMDVLADRIANRNGSPSKIVLMLNEKELGWANIKSINAITQQTGTLQLSLV